MGWGDKRHIEQLKDEEKKSPYWPGEWPDDPKKVKAAEKKARRAEQVEQRRIEKANRATAKAARRVELAEYWSAQKASKASGWPAADAANAKAEAWELKQLARAEKDKARAARDIAKAAKAQARWDREIQKEMAKGAYTSPGGGAYYEEAWTAPRGCVVDAAGCASWLAAMIVILLFLAVVGWYAS